MPDERAYGQFVGPGFKGVEAFDAVDVDQDPRAHDAHVEHRHQALAAGQHSAVRTAIAQDRKCVLQIMRCVIVELRRFHVSFDLCLI